MKKQNSVSRCLENLFCFWTGLINKFRSKKAILLIKDDGLGDLILWLPYQAEIRKHYPPEQYRIDLLVKSELAGFAQSIPDADRVLILPKYRNRLQWNWFRLIFYLTHAYDMVCNVTVLPHGMWHAYGRANFVTMLLKDSVFSDAVYHFRNVVYVDGLDIRERYQAVLSCLGITSTPEKFDYAKFCSPVNKIAGKYFVICPGAGDGHRCWEAEKYIQLADRLLSNWNGYAVLVGTSAERDLCEQIRQSCKYPNRLKNLGGKLAIPELFEQLRQGDFLVTNDTGTCHIGAAIGIKTFIICGQGDYGSFVPYPPEWENVHCIFSNRKCRCRLWNNEECRKQKIYPCIAEISVDDVWNNIKQHAEFKLEDL